jgi:hypothetical protein
MSLMTLTTRALILGAALLVTLASAQPHPRATELLALLDAAMTVGSDAREVPTALSMNVTTRSFREGETYAALMSIAVDMDARAVRTRVCLDGELTFDVLVRDGMQTSWDRFGDEITEEPIADEALREMLEQAFIAPDKLFAIDAEQARYDGFVDYGVIAGEQVSVRLEGAAMAGFAGQDGEVGVVFGEDGNWLGQVMSTGQGRMLLVSDGMMRVEGGLMPRGATMYELVGGRAGERLATTRFWRIRSHETLDPELLSLTRPEDSSWSEARHELDRRMESVQARLDEVEAGSEEYFELLDELIEVGDARHSSRFQVPPPRPCPGPF